MRSNQELIIDIYLQWKTSFILYDDGVLKSIQKLRQIVNQVYWRNARKQSIFHTVIAAMQVIFRVVKHARMLLNMF